MSSATSATTASIFAFILAVLWLIVLAVPFNWLWMDNMVFRCQTNLWTVTLSKGSVTSILGFAVRALSNKASAALDSLFDKNMFINEAAQQFCAPVVNGLFQWCDEWYHIQWASIALLFLGFLAAVFLAMGAAFMYYYALAHATYTGRQWIRICFIAAPVLAFVAMLQYTMLTLFVGRFDNSPGIHNLLVDGVSSWDVGFFFGWFLAFLSWVPLFIQAVFGKVDPNEKRGDDDFFESGGQLAPPGYAGYGAASMQQQPLSSGMGSPPGGMMGGPPMMGTAPGYQATIAVTYAGPPLQPQGPLPGMGAPAW